MIRLSVCLLAVLTAIPAFAGNRVGNGGDVVVCPAKIQLLDFYEAKTPPATGKGYQEIVNAKLELLSKLAPKLGEQYRRRAKTIQGDLEFKSEVALKDVEDSLHAFLPKDCDLKQIAIRQNIAVAGSKRFLIDKELWSKLEAGDQAGLILHEIIYEHFSKIGSEDSRKARKLNAYLFSPEAEKANSGKFWLMMKELEVAVYP